MRMPAVFVLLLMVTVGGCHRESALLPHQSEHVQNSSSQPCRSIAGDAYTQVIRYEGYRLYQEGKLEEAVVFLDRYLHHEPNDQQTLEVRNAIKARKLDEERSQYELPRKWDFWYW